jgi:hypothetical protein
MPLARGRALAAIGLGLVAVSSVQASAQQHCVQCFGPSATYRCIVDGDGSAASGKLECITALAAEGRHESCGVGIPIAQPCQGPVRRVTALSTGPLSGSQRPAAQPDPAQRSSDEEDRRSPGEPETVEAIARRMAPTAANPLTKVSEQIGKFGTAVGGAARKSWDCLATLFRTCGEP